MTVENGFVLGPGSLVVSAAGVLRKPAATTTTVVTAWTLLDGGAVDVQAGALVLASSSGTVDFSAGSLFVSAFAAVTFRSGTVNIGSVQGNGSLSFAGADVTAVAAPNLSSLATCNVFAGTLTLQGVGRTAAALLVGGGAVVVSGVVEVDGTVSVTAGTLRIAQNGSLGFGGGGTLRSSVILGGPSSVLRFNAGTFVVDADASLTGATGTVLVLGDAEVSIHGAVALGPGALVQVAGNGALVINATADSAWSLSARVLASGSGRVVVKTTVILLSLLTVIQSAGVTVLSPATLVIQGGASFATSGNVTVAPNATLDIELGSVYLNASNTTASGGASSKSVSLSASSSLSSSPYTFSGDVRLNGGSLTVAVDVNVPSGQWYVSNGRLEFFASNNIQATLAVLGGIVAVATPIGQASVVVQLGGLLHTAGFISVGDSSALAVPASAPVCQITSTLFVSPTGRFELPNPPCVQAPTAQPTAVPTQLVYLDSQM